MDPVVGSALISGGSGILSSLFGYKSNKETNQTNLEIAQMNNEWSEKMMDKQFQYDLQMWNKNNEYNTASAQVQRLKEAGLNPALFMGSNAAGHASGGSSVGLPSPSQAKMRPYDFSSFHHAIEGALMFAQSIQKNQAEIDFINTQKDVLKAEAKAKIAELTSRTNNLDELTRGAKYDREFRKIMESTRVSIENEDYLAKVQSREMNDLSMTLMRQTKAMNRIQLTNLDDQMKADIALKIAQAENMSIPEFGKELKFFEKKYGQRISKSDLKAIFEAWKFAQEKDSYRYSIYDIPSLLGGGLHRMLNK